MRLGDLDALKEDFKARLEKAKRWKENAINNGDDEIVIRATATIDFICEVIMTINNAPTVELTEEQAIDKLHETGWLIRHDKEMTERPQGEWVSVSERLPEDRNLVLVTAYWHETYQVMQASYFGEGEKNGWWCVPWNNCGEHMRNDLHVIAWQLLPEPYKKGGAA